MPFWWLARMSGAAHNCSRPKSALTHARRCPDEHSGRVAALRTWRSFALTRALTASVTGVWWFLYTYAGHSAAFLADLGFNRLARPPPPLCAGLCAHRHLTVER